MPHVTLRQFNSGELDWKQTTAYQEGLTERGISLMEMEITAMLAAKYSWLTKGDEIPAVITGFNMHDNTALYAYMVQTKKRVELFEEVLNVFYDYGVTRCQFLSETTYMSIDHDEKEKQEELKDYLQNGGDLELWPGVETRIVIETMDFTTHRSTVYHLNEDKSLAHLKTTELPLTPEMKEPAFASGIHVVMLALAKNATAGTS